MLIFGFKKYILTYIIGFKKYFIGYNTSSDTSASVGTRLVAFCDAVAGAGRWQMCLEYDTNCFNIVNFNYIMTYLNKGYVAGMAFVHGNSENKHKILFSILEL